MDFKSTLEQNKIKAVILSWKACKLLNVTYLKWYFRNRHIFLSTSAECTHILAHIKYTLIMKLMLCAQHRIDIVSNEREYYGIINFLIRLEGWTFPSMVAIYLKILYIFTRIFLYANTSMSLVSTLQTHFFFVAFQLMYI
jgi:hypothetical protein